MSRSAQPRDMKIAHHPAKTAWIIPAALVIAALLVYIPAFNGAFVFDDYNRILADQSVQPRSLVDLKDLVIDRGRLHRRPLVNISLAINWLVHGLWAPGFHIFNIAVHMLAGLTLYCLIRRTINHTATTLRPWSTLIACTAALLWIVHPLNTQAVTYIIQRSESMMGLFYLFTLYALLRSATAPEPAAPQSQPDAAAGERSRHIGAPHTASTVTQRFDRWAGLAIISALAAILTKEVAVTLPVAAFLYDRCFLAGSFAAAIRQRWVLHLALTCTWAILLVNGAISGILGLSPPQNPDFATVGFAYAGASPVEYLLTQSEVIWRYLRLSVWPDALSIDYDWPIARHVADVWPALLSMVMLVCAALWLLWKQPRIGFVVAWFFLLLAPTSSIIPVKDPIVEHRMYLPLAALTLLCTLAIARLLRARHSRISTAPLIAVATALLMCTVALGARTVHQNMRYESPWRVWKNALDLGHDTFRTRANLADSYRLAGMHQQAVDTIAPLIARSAASWNISPDDPRYAAALYTNAASLLALGRATEAAESYAQVIALCDAAGRPRRMHSVYRRASYDQAIMAWRRNDVDTAEQHLRSAIDAGGERFAQAHFMLGTIAASTRDLETAETAFQTTLEIDPDHVEALVSLGGVLINSGRARLAQPLLRRAVELAPEHGRARYNLAFALQTIGSIDDARSEYRRITRQQAEYPRAQQRLSELDAR